MNEQEEKEFNFKLSPANVDALTWVPCNAGAAASRVPAAACRERECPRPTPPHPTTTTTHTPPHPTTTTHPPTHPPTHHVW